MIRSTPALVLFAAFTATISLPATTFPARRAPQDTTLLQAMLAAEDARVETPVRMGPLLAGLTSDDPETQRIAVRALGRLERPSLVPTIASLLSSPAPSVRAEAANALGQSVFNGGAELVFDSLLTHLVVDDDPLARGAIAEALGRLPYDTAARIEHAKHALLAASQSVDGAWAPLETLVGVARGFESLARRQSATLPLSDSTLMRLEALARYRSQERSANGTSSVAFVRRLATAALTSSGRVGAGWIEEQQADSDEQVRRLAVVATGALREGPEQLARLLATAIADASPMVRYEALRQTGGREQLPNGCDPILRATSDPSPTVALLAIDLLGARCADHARTVSILIDMVAGRDASRVVGSWHSAAHAAVALALVEPDSLRPLLPRFVAHENFFVRMYAARAAAVLLDAALLETLAFDEHHNVREVAIGALNRLRGHTADSIYIAALKSGDYQLVRTAVSALAGTPNGDVVVPALLAALHRITLERRQTSRDARTALLERVAELGDVNYADALRPYLGDFDAAVAELAASVLSSWTGSTHMARPQPGPTFPLPSMEEIGRLDRSRAIIHMRGGTLIEVALFASEAPTNAARFVRLARSDYFNGLTFHRVAPNFVIQGGSPGANEFAGDGPYTRDELTARPHLRGTVGLSTRGRDTGDAQIFINLVDNVRLDHNYTIFGEVVRGMDVVDATLEGAEIERIVISY
jgi:cyclophilin family peptidyl-prolyl cis-trans isomerase/HEAT repeat protein